MPGFHRPLSPCKPSLINELRAGRLKWQVEGQTIAFVPTMGNLLRSSHEDIELVILAAAFMGKTRLIDNLQFTLSK